MADYEVAELLKSTNMYDLALKTNHKIALTAEEDEAKRQLDAYFKDAGARGVDANHEIAAFMNKVVNEEIYNTPDELLDSLFDQSTIGEFDDFEATTTPKNTLVAYEAAKGGNVKRSFLDIGVLKPTWKNRQIETDISFADLRRNGWKTISTYTEYALAAFKNMLFKDIFDVIDVGIASGAENYIDATSMALPDLVTADALSLYLQDRNDNGSGLIIARSKYIQAMSKLKGYLSDELMNEINRTGRLGTYDGCSLIPISSAKKLGDGTGLIADKRIFGIAGKIGSLNMKGEIHTYQVEDPNKEQIHLLFKDFTYGYAFNKDTLDNVVKVVLK